VVGRLHDVVDPDRTMVRVAIVGVLDRQGFAGRAADRVVVREVEVGGVLVGHGLAAVDQDLQLPLAIVTLQFDRRSGRGRLGEGHGAVQE